MAIPGVEGAYQNWRAAGGGAGPVLGPAATPAAIKTEAENFHTAFEDEIKNGIGNPEDVRELLDRAEKEGFDLNNLENRCAMVSDLVRGRDSNWATNDIKARIEGSFGSGWAGNLKAKLAGATEENFRRGHEAQADEIKRRTVKVLGKTAASGALSAGLMGAVTVLGGPVTWTLVGGAVVGGGVARAGVEAWRTAFSKEREERDRVNQEYLKHYDSVGRLAQEILLLETESRDITKSPDDIQKAKDEINQKYTDLIQLVNSNHLAAQEKTLRENEVKWEKRSNWGAAIGAGAVAVTELVHGVVALNNGGGVHINLDSNLGTHVVSKAGENGFNFASNATSTQYALTEGWGQIGASLASGGYGVAGELASNHMSENSSNLDVNNYDENRKKAFESREITDRQAKMEAAKPVEEEKVEPDGPELANGKRYIFENVTLNSDDPLITPPPIQVIKDKELWEISGSDKDFIDIFSVEDPTNKLRVGRKQLVEKGNLWEHEGYNSPEDWQLIEDLSPIVDLLKQQKFPTDVKFRDAVHLPIPLARNVEYQYVNVDVDRNKVRLIEKATGIRVEINVSDLVTIVDFENTPDTSGAPSPSSPDTLTPLEKLEDEYEAENGKAFKSGDSLYIKTAFKSKDRRNAVDLSDGSIWLITGIDESNLTINLQKDEDGEKATVLIKDVVKNAQDIDKHIHEMLDSSGYTGLKPDKLLGSNRKEGLRRRIEPGQKWKFLDPSVGHLVQNSQYIIQPTDKRAASFQVMLKPVGAGRGTKAFPVEKREFVDMSQFEFIS